MYISIAIAAYLVLAIVGILDKFIVEKSVPDPIVLTFYSTIFLFPLFLLAPLGVGMPAGLFDWAMCAVSGFGFSIALFFSYRGLRDCEVSHLGPLIGAATPFFVFLLGRIFLPESLDRRQLIAIGFLIIGSIIISLEHSRHSTGWQKGIGWGVLAGLLFAISHLASKYIYGVYDFSAGILWTRWFMGVFGALLLAAPSVRALFGGRSIHRSDHDRRAGYAITIVVVSKLLGLIGVMLEQYAIAIGSVTIVNALVGVQYGCLIALVMLLSFFAPRIFREDYSAGKIAQEFSAVACIAVGLYLLV